MVLSIVCLTILVVAPVLSSPTVGKRAAASGNLRFTDAEKKYLLDQHNELRKTTSPPSKYMATMEWSTEIEDYAVEWAICGAKWYTHRSGDDKVNRWGENMAYSASTGAMTVQGAMESAINGWWSEDQYYDFDANTCAAGEQCGHYTQMAWNETQYLGCGYAVNCPEGDTSTYEYNTWVVCNYNPAGNVYYSGVMRLPYEKGADSSVDLPPVDLPPVDSPPSDNDCSIAECKNGGVLDAANCRCFCLAGTAGPDCSCMNKESWEHDGDPTYKCTWFEAVTCTCPYWGSYLTTNCPVLCGTCEGVTTAASEFPTTSDACPGVECKNAGILDVANCKCSCPTGTAGSDCSCMNEETWDHEGDPSYSCTWFQAVTCTCPYWGAELRSNCKVLCGTCE